MDSSLPLVLARTGNGPLHLQLAEQFRAAIRDGRLQAGHRLPSTRDLARELSVSRSVAQAAYDQLHAEGWIAGRTGSGTYVADVVPLQPVLRAAARPPAPAEPPLLTLRPGIPYISPTVDAGWRRAWREVSIQPLTRGYDHPAGLPDLRAALADHVGRVRGIACGPENLLITDGTSHGLRLLLSLTLRQGDRIAIEDPGFATAVSAAQQYGLEVVDIGVDEDGLLVSDLGPDLSAVYVTPSHQYPLGLSMSLDRRLELLDWAERNDAVLVEDDYDTEFRYTGRPLEPLHSLDSRGRVVYVGSFSKVLSPALRLGFLVAPPSLVPALVKARYLTDWHAPNVEQAGLAAFMAEGGFARHVRRMRKVYRARHELLAALLARDFADFLTLLPSTAGLHLSAIAAADCGGLVRAARRRGVRLYSLGDFGVGERRHGLVFGYGAVAAERIEPGLARLRALADEGAV